MEKIVVRRVSDLLQEGFDREILAKEFVRINSEAWPPPVPEEYLWNEEKMCAQFSNCPHLLFCAFEGDKIVGTLSMIHTEMETARQTTDWIKTSGNGTLCTHRTEGDCAFGVDLSVQPGAKAGDALADMGILSGVVLANKAGVFLGSRAPRYHKTAERMSIDRHVGLIGGKVHDPEVRYYQAAGFKSLRVIPNYMVDPKSCNYGVLMFWENPYYRFTRFAPNFIMRMVSWAVHKWIFRH